MATGIAQAMMDKINPPQGSVFASMPDIQPATPATAPVQPPVPQIASAPQIDNVAESKSVAAQAAQAAPAATATLTNANLDPNGLVENRVGNILNTNSPLMQLAAARAKQTANDRGLSNSSMAVGDAQKAVMDAATPIATTDANATNQFALTNANAANRNSEFNATSTNDINKTNAGLSQQANLQNASQAQRTSELNAASQNQATATNIDNQLKTLLANADASTKAYLTQLDDSMKQKIQSSANMATLFNAYTQQATAILTSDKLDKAGKESALAGLQAMLKDSVATQDAITGLDISNTVLGPTSNSSASAATQTQIEDLSTQLAKLQQQLNSMSQQQNNPNNGWPYNAGG